MKYVHVGNICLLNKDNPLEKGTVLVKNVEFYYNMFRRIVTFNNINVNTKEQALDDYDFLKSQNASTDGIKYMEDMYYYEVTPQEFSRKKRKVR